jgi:hypothetical protein
MMQLQELLIDEEAEATRRALDKAKKEKEVKDRLDMIRHNTEQASTHGQHASDRKRGCCCWEEEDVFTFSCRACLGR